MIKAKAVSFSYGKFKALDNINLDVKDGCIFGLIGPNGSGKTTLIKLFAGIFKQNSGQLSIKGKIGYMPQESSIYEQLTVEENIRLFLAICGKKEEEIKQLLDLMALEKKRKELVSRLSEGMKKRLSLTIALLNEPDIVLLDDPTSTIDPVTRAHFWSYFREFAKRGKTIIVSTHIMSEAEKCDEIALLSEGKMWAVGTPKEIVKKARVKNLDDAFARILGDRY